LPGPTAENNRFLTDKTVQRAAWDAAKLPGPPWCAVQADTLDCDEILRDVPLPAIVKPADSAGSRGIGVVTMETQLPGALAHALSFSASGKAIVEGFIAGTEYTVETFSHAGLTHVLAVTEKRKVAGTNNTVAAELRTMEGQSELTAALCNLSVAALAALGHKDGPGHTEILQSSSGELYLVESAGRGGGFGVFEGLIPAVSGFDIVSACVEQAMGWQPRLPVAGTSRHAVLRFVPSPTGRIRSIHGVSEANQIEGVQAEALVEVGDRVSAAVSDGDRLALILSTASSLKQALDNADQAESEIRFELENTELGTEEHCASH